MISARTSFQLTRRVLSRATGSALAYQSPSMLINGSSSSVAAQFFSAEAVKPMVPGVGRAKTSTGLVRFDPFFLYIDLLVF
jgi:hypothetical protein